MVFQNDDSVPYFVLNNEFVHKTLSLGMLDRLANKYLEGWNLTILSRKLPLAKAALCDTDYKKRRGIILIDPDSCKSKKEIYISVIHEVLHIDPDLEPRAIVRMAEQLSTNLDFQDEGARRRFKFMCSYFTDGWKYSAENGIEELAQKLANYKQFEKDFYSQAESSFDDIWEKQNLEKLLLKKRSNLFQQSLFPKDMMGQYYNSKYGIQSCHNFKKKND